MFDLEFKPDYLKGMPHDESFYLDVIRSTNFIHEDLKSISSTFCKLGFHLWELKRHVFKVNPNIKNTFKEFHFYCYVQEAFGISKTTCNNYIRVCELFSCGETMNINLDVRYRNYNLSQLVEMSSLNRSIWGKVKPEMTVKQIRALKQLPDKSSDISGKASDPTSGQEPEVHDSFINIYKQRTSHNLEDDLLQCLTSSIKNVDKVKNLVQLLNDFYLKYGD